ncbi:hypothetical protein L9F63_016300 [Diploptera punctata]|uniref:Ankyrin repeat protein n=1 Tax=Diploptera punctata TaxID=6984 RepID=A0AAD8A2R8_DIPPU|nr:hypothetical protein L9F63_016300 [Diploptera punctata]
MELNPVSTICNPKPDPHTQLLEAWQSRDIDTFRSLLQDPEVSPDHWYDDHNATCLYLVVKEDQGAPFAKALIESGAQINISNPSRKKYPVHVAAEYAQDEILEILLSSSDINVNVLDGSGDTPLHIIAKHKTKNDSQDTLNRYKHCVHLLMNQSGIDPNITNKKGYTAVQWAAQFGSKELLQTILENAGDDLDVDSCRTLLKAKTAREFILEKYPELSELLPETQENRKYKVDVNNLFQHLYRNEEEEFISALESFPEKESIEKNNGSVTLLQYIAEHGLFWAAKALIQKGAKPHATCEHELRSPALLACYGGYADILDLLLNHDVESINLRGPKGEGTALHIIFNNPQVFRPNEERNYRECLNILLKILPKIKLDINATDIKGNTALHYAAKNGDEYAVNALLKRGAYIGVKNMFGDSPLVHMSPEMLETFLNDCLSANDKLPREDFYEVTFSYNFLVPPSTKEEILMLH